MQKSEIQIGQFYDWRGTEVVATGFDGSKVVIESPEIGEEGVCPSELTSCDDDSYDESQAEIYGLNEWDDNLTEEQNLQIQNQKWKPNS